MPFEIKVAGKDHPARSRVILIRRRRSFLLSSSPFFGMNA
jgi:hypothetical protein